MTILVPTSNELRFLQGSGIVVKPVTLTDFNFEIVVEEDVVQVAEGSTSPAIDNDAEVTRSTGATTENKFEVALQFAEGDIDQLNEVVLSVSGAGTLNGNTVTRSSDGACTIRADHPYITKQETVTFLRSTGQTSDTFDTYVLGTLASSIYTNVKLRATGATSDKLPIFSAQDHITPSYTRNPTGWLSDVNLTAISPWNSTGGTQRAGVAITPKHVLFAWHFQINIGATIRFVTADNQIITRTITNKTSIAGGYETDCTIAVLDSDLPGTITPMRFFPSDLLDYLPTLATYHLPAIGLDAQEKAICKEITNIRNVSSTPIYCFFSNSVAYPNLTENIIGGDSGNPIFCIVENEPILLSLWTSISSGPAFHTFLSSIDSALTTLGGGYSLDTIDLSGFTNYG